MYLVETVFTYMHVLYCFTGYWVMPSSKLGHFLPFIEENCLIYQEISLVWTGVFIFKFDGIMCISILITTELTSLHLN